METLRLIQLKDRGEVREDEYIAVLRNSQRELESDRSTTLPLEVSAARGKLPVLSHKTDIDNQRIAVVANCAALSFNAVGFVRDHLDPEIGNITAHDKVAYGPRMLTYSLSGDEFIFESPDPTKSELALNQIASSFAHIGIEVTTNFKHVDSVDSWVKAQRGQTPILANANDPLLLANFGRTFAEREKYFQVGLIHAAAYTKNAMTEAWKEAGVPVPPTYYYTVNGNIAEVSTDIASVLGQQGYSHAVLSTYDGAGGDGVRFVSLENIGDRLFGRFADGNIMVQGLLPLEASPCVIANISDNQIEPLLISKQRFSSPGAHGGNIWEKGTALIDSFPSDFMPVVMKSLETLHKKGVRGQVNVDPLVINPETAERFGLSDTTLMREANIRPAGSSVNLRIQQGMIEGQSINRAHTTSFEIPLDVLRRSDFWDILNSYRIPGTQVVLYGYDIYADKASIAFVGVEGIIEEQLNIVEQDTRALFK